jgi:hypothetical protein
VREVIAEGARTADMVASPAMKTISTSEIGERIRGALGVVAAPYRVA